MGISEGFTLERVDVGPAQLRVRHGGCASGPRQAIVTLAAGQVRSEVSRTLSRRRLSIRLPPMAARSSGSGVSTVTWCQPRAPSVPLTGLKGVTRSS